jgi:Uma2 family endonuclease
MQTVIEEIYTVKDYEKWEGDWELIEGRPYAMAPAPFNKHQWIATKIGYILNTKLKKCKDCFALIEAEYRVNQKTVLRPDVSLICDKLGKYITKPPLIIFEVISESTRLRDEILKKEIYKKQKVPFYVLIYPDGKINIFDLKNEKKINAFKLNTPCGEIEINKDEILEEITL